LETELKKIMGALALAIAETPFWTLGIASIVTGGLTGSSDKMVLLGF